MTHPANLVDTLLADVGDDGPLDDHVTEPSPLHDLLVAYGVLADQDGALPRITRQSTGRELKAAIRRLPPGQQVIVLAQYDHTILDLHATHAYDRKVLVHATRNLQRQVYILTGLVVFFMLSVFIGVVIATAVHMRVVTAGTATNNLLEIARQIIELFL